MIAYPPSRKADDVDILHGTPVPDPYRWLEDLTSPETAAWVEAQNALTRSVLDRPRRAALVERLWRLYDHPRTGAPITRGGRLFATHNTGLQNQPVVYVAESSVAPFRMLVDPNTFSADGTAAITALAPNEAGTVLAYGVSQSGSDRQDIRLLDVETGAHLPDRILWAKFVSVAWVPDDSGFYYTRFPEPGTVAPGDEHYFCSVWFHTLGRPQAEDTLVFDAPHQRETVFEVDLTPDGRWLVITALMGASDKSEVYVQDRLAGARPRPLVTGFDWAWKFAGADGPRLFFVTDGSAPRRRIAAIDATADRAGPQPIVGEGDDALSEALLAGGFIVAVYLHHASDRLRTFTLSGEPRGDLTLPGIGALTGIDGRPDDPELVIGYTSFTEAPSAFACSLASPAPSFSRIRVGAGRNSQGSQGTNAQGAPGAEYDTEQVWYSSRDGTRISMFLVCARGLAADGRRPVLLTGYGGFNISLTPVYDAASFLVLEAGGILAVPNLRGGGEYGEAWHEAGMLDRKQNVFDDFVAAAEHLVAAGWTHPGRIAIEGGSNGGLLTAAAMLQRPDLFGAVVCRVPVTDMLRYHLFTVGRFWIPEYGSADDPQAFGWLRRYSPYHNVRDDVRYPPILITTADTDDRVFPGMAMKLAARLQAARGNHSPVLVRIETKAGHGAGKPLAKIVDEDADVFTFVLDALDGRL